MKFDQIIVYTYSFLWLNGKDIFVLLRNLESINVIDGIIVQITQIYECNVPVIVVGVGFVGLLNSHKITKYEDPGDNSTLKSYFIQ